MVAKASLDESVRFVRWLGNVVVVNPIGIHGSGQSKRAIALQESASCTRVFAIGTLTVGELSNTARDSL